MRIRSAGRYGRNPKGPKLTPEQEKQLAVAESAHARAEIYTLGVSESIKHGAYHNLEVAAQLLNEAAQLRRSAYTLRDATLKEPVPPKRKGVKNAK